MKLTAKEAYLLMKEGIFCVGDGIVYRIRGPVQTLEYGCLIEDYPEKLDWTPSTNLPVQMLSMNWSSLGDFPLSHTEEIKGGEIDCYPKVHIDRLEKRLDDLCGAVDNNTKRIEKLFYTIKGMVNEFSQHFKGWAI